MKKHMAIKVGILGLVAGATWYVVGIMCVILALDLQIVTGHTFESTPECQLIMVGAAMMGLGLIQMIRSFAVVYATVENEPPGGTRGREAKSEEVGSSKRGF